MFITYPLPKRFWQRLTVQAAALIGYCILAPSHHWTRTLADGFFYLALINGVIGLALYILNKGAWDTFYWSFQSMQQWIRSFKGSPYRQPIRSLTPDQRLSHHFPQLYQEPLIYFAINSIGMIISLALMALLAH